MLLGAVALATLAAALLHGPALAALGLVGAYVTPMLVASTEPNYWALYIYLAVVTAAAFALALMRLWQWLALIAIAFGFVWLLPGIKDSGVEALAAHLFHVAVGYGLSAALIVAGLLYGPSAEPGKIDPLSVVVLSVYGFGALILVLASRHDPAALTIFTLITIATVAIAWRSEAAAGAVPVAAIFIIIFIIRWALAPELAYLIAPAGRRDKPRRSLCTAASYPISRWALASPCCSAPADSWRRAARNRRSSRSCGARRASPRRS